MLGTSILIYFFSKGKQLQQLFKAVKALVEMMIIMYGLSHQCTINNKMFYKQYRGWLASRTRLKGFLLIIKRIGKY